MAKMLFTSQQPNVLVIPLPNGKTDVTVLTNETEVVIKNEDDNSSAIQFQYDGNQFRTVKKRTGCDRCIHITTYWRGGNFMRTLVLSLRRLYEKNKVSLETVLKLKENGKITKEEENYILYGNIEG